MAWGLAVDDEGFNLKVQELAMREDVERRNFFPFLYF